MLSLDSQTAFDKLVALKYEIYNALFLTLPFSSLETTGIKLPLFVEMCQKALLKGNSPTEVVLSFFDSIIQTKNDDKRLETLFLFAQLIERQVVLFDALEEAAFSEIHSCQNKGSVNDLIKRFSNKEKHIQLLHSLKKYRTRVVLTAHPTQFYPEPVLKLIRELAQALQKDDLLWIEKILLQLGKTPFRNLSSPLPLSEADNLIERIREVFYEAIINIEQQFYTALEKGRPEFPLVELGFWPGADRDGNPYVNVTTTLTVAEHLRECAFSHYNTLIEKLKDRLTFPKMEKELNFLADRMPHYQDPKELIDDLTKLRKLIVEKHQSLFVEYIDHFLLAVKTFGFHFASLDLRQDSSIHEEVIAILLSKFQSEMHWPKEAINYGHLAPENKALLLEQLCTLLPANVANFSIKDPEIAQDLLGSLKAIATIQKRNGSKGLQRYIISNTQGAHHILEILLLAYLLGYHTFPIDIVPLFETVEDLKNAAQSMKRIYHSETYRNHLKQRENRQVIMVGFSDGTKDGGYLTCNWEILKAKQQLESLSREFGIETIFFDGRGGPPARGGGNTHKFYRAVGECLDQQEVQLTIQGQTISSTFGSIESARFNLEQFFTSGLEAQLLKDIKNKNHYFSIEELDLMNALSDRSYQTYMDLRNHPYFLSFLEEMTPLKYFGQLNVASRPVKRKQNEKLSLKDLRAIPFVGSWSQIKLNVPGFYGLGTALEWAFKNGKESILKNLYEKNSFFNTLIDNAMQALAKSNISYTNHLLKDPSYGTFIQIIHDEVERTIFYLLKLSHQSCLLETDPINQKSIHLREKLILPLVIIQQYAMQRIKTATEPTIQKAYEKLLLKTLPSITNASRNSA